MPEPILARRLPSRSNQAYSFPRELPVRYTSALARRRNREANGLGLRRLLAEVNERHGQRAQEEESCQSPGEPGARYARWRGSRRRVRERGRRLCLFQDEARIAGVALAMRNIFPEAAPQQIRDRDRDGRRQSLPVRLALENRDDNVGDGFARGLPDAREWPILA